MAQNKDIVLVIDVSASMQTLPGTRFAEAQRHALAILDALPSDRQMALIAAGRQPRVLTFFTNEKVLLRQAITELQADDAPGNMREAILSPSPSSRACRRRKSSSLATVPIAA